MQQSLDNTWYQTGTMATLLYILLVVSICRINCRAAEEKIDAMDFRPNKTPMNGRSPKVHTDCQAAYDDGWQQSGLYTISPDGSKQLDVFCEQTNGGGWIVIMRRTSAAMSFYRNWAEYKNGFGDLLGDFWCGNDMLHYMTHHKDKKLMFEMHDRIYAAYAEYSTFYVDSEDNKYQLHVGGFTSTNNPGDGFSKHNNKYFSTIDRDNDDSATVHCALRYTGAWWHHHCYESQPTGTYGERVNWQTWKDHGQHPKSLSTVKMMIKKK